MSNKESSDEMASKAGRIMGMARLKGGPLSHFEAEIRREFGVPDGEPSAVMEKLPRILQPYFDDAESLAASVLSQKEAP